MATLFSIAVMLGSAYFVFNEAVKGGGYVEIPDIVGLPLAKASNLLAEAGLEIGAQNHVVNDHYPEYHVILQRPASGKVVRMGRKVRLTVSAGSQYETSPRLIGRSLEAALKQLEGTRLIGGSVARIPSEAVRGTVLAQDPTPGRDVPTGGEIHLLVSDGARVETVFMPTLVGKSLSEAQRILGLLNVTVAPYKVRSSGAKYDVILAQIPKSGTLLREGQLVSYDVRLLPGTLLANVRRRVNVVYTVPNISFNPQIRVDVIDHQGQRKTVYPRPSDFQNGVPPRLPSGTIITIPTSFIDKATVEFYADGSLHKTFYYEGDSEPVITNYESPRNDPRSATVTMDALPSPDGAVSNRGNFARGFGPPR